MSYVINSFSGSITLPLGAENTTATPLTLIGRNWSSANAQQGYGQALNQNFVSLLENFASTTQPVSPLTGQFWYDATTDEVKFNEGTPATPVWATLFSSSSLISSIANGTSSVSIPVVNGNVNTSVGGTANVFVVTSGGANVLGTLTSNSQIIGDRLRSTVNNGVTPPLTVASAVTVVNLSADLLDGYHASLARNSLNTVVVRNATTGLVDNDIAGNIDGAFGNLTNINSTAINSITIAGALTTASQPNITSIGLLTSLTSTGAITAPTFTGNLTGNATTAGTVTDAAQPNITSIGSLTGLTSTGTVNFAGTSNTSLGIVANVKLLGGSAGQFLTTNGLGDIDWVTIGTSGIVNGSSNVTIDVVNGNVNTSVGGTANVFVATLLGANVLGTLGVTGNISGGNITTVGNISGGNLVLTGNLTLPVGSGVQASNITATGNISGGNISTNGALTVTGTTNLGLVGNVTIQGGTSGQFLQTNGSGVLAWATIGSSGISNGVSSVSIPVIDGNVNTSVGSAANVFVVTATGANVIGTFAATGNIVGANLTTAGAITGGNVLTAGTVTASRIISNVATGTAPLTVASTTVVANLAATTAETATTAGTVTTAAQPNITSLGTLTSVVVNGTTGLGAVGNVAILGGTSGQFLQTNGSGLLAWATVGTSGIANGLSAVSIPVVDGNVNISVGAASNVVVATATGANVVGTLTATGNISGANLVSTGVANIGSLRTTTITAGANTTPGTITGTWTLSTGSTLQSTYADLAEYYVISGRAGAGTVVEFGGPEEIQVCNTAMSRRVAGVITTNPAFLMNENGGLPGQARAAVALQGRVPCKVVGLVRKGDLMVSAGNGCAASSDEPTIGSVIGKSLVDKLTVEQEVIEIAVGRL